MCCCGRWKSVSRETPWLAAVNQIPQRTILLPVNVISPPLEGGASQLLALYTRLESAKSEIKGIGEKQCLRNWKERLHSLRAARAALVLQSQSVWLRTERTWPSHTRKVPMRPRRSSRRLNALAERRSQFRRTPLMPAPSKPRSKRPWRHLAGSTSL